ncbi:MAG: hypothetical protein MGAcid_12510 [uncultured Acidilobus sp. MG]|nr:MAG: hypothetical protein MGAcid_12510 [uncultured Acidilobus sp. MG]
MRKARALALVLIIVVSASLLAGLFYTRLNLFHRRGVIIIRAYAIGSDGDPTQLTNASFSVWAWAPTPNGTEFIPVFNGTGAQAVINLSRLVGWAEDWIHAYGKAAIFSFEPSIIIWVSYSIALPNGSVELVTQPSFQPLNLSLPLSGSGAVIDVMVSHPFRTLLKANGREAGVAVRGLAKVSPEQTTTTTVSTTPAVTSTYTHTYGLMVWYWLVPHVIAWYPNDTGVAPISLAIALAQPSAVSGGSAYVNIFMAVVSSKVFYQYTINGLTIAGSAFDAAVDDAEAGDLSQAISQLSPALGATFTFTTGGAEVANSNSTGAVIPPGDDDIGQLYMLGQVALINWTALNVLAEPVGWYLGLQLTEFKAVESNGALAPVIYTWEAYVPCVNLSEWAIEQQALMQDPGDPHGLSGDLIAYPGGHGGGSGATCPLPNTPAPVIWQDYATKLTHYATLKPNSLPITISYANLSIGLYGAESPLSIAIDLGSAIASIAGTALSAAGFPKVVAALEVIGGLLGSVQYQSNSAAASVTDIAINNGFWQYNVSVYYSNLTPVYWTASGYGFTLPKGLILINVTS